MTKKDVQTKAYGASPEGGGAVASLSCLTRHLRTAALFAGFLPCRLAAEAKKKPEPATLSGLCSGAN
jgi:hypothetical protein